MKIYSEITNKEYTTVDDCLKAEKEAIAKKEAEKAKKEKLANARKDRAKEVKDAFEKANDLLNAFVEDYGSYHLSIGNGFKGIDKFFDGLGFSFFGL